LRKQVEKRLEEKRKELIILTSQLQALENQRQALLQRILQLQGFVQGLEEFLKESESETDEVASE